MQPHSVLQDSIDNPNRGGLFFWKKIEIIHFGINMQQLKMDQTELEDLLLEKEKWILEEKVLSEKMDHLECMIQQLENQVHSRMNPPELDVEKELMIFSKELLFTEKTLEDKTKNAARECVSNVQQYGEPIVAICCSLWWDVDMYQVTDYYTTLCVITSTKVYRVNIASSPLDETVKIGKLHQSYQFESPLVYEYCNVFRSFGHSTFDSPPSICYYNEELAYQLSVKSKVTYDEYYKRLESIINCIPGTTYPAWTHLMSTLKK